MKKLQYIKNTLKKEGMQFTTLFLNVQCTLYLKTILNCLPFFKKNIIVYIIDFLFDFTPYFNMC